MVTRADGHGHRHLDVAEGRLLLEGEHLADEGRENVRIHRPQHPQRLGHLGRARPSPEAQAGSQVADIAGGQGRLVRAPDAHPGTGDPADGS